MRLWRLTRAPFAALDGKGAERHGTRYAPAGAPLVNFASEAGLAVRVGIMDRLVRLILVLVALLVPPLLVPGLWLLAVGSWFTVGQRMWYVRGHIDRA